MRWIQTASRRLALMILLPCSALAQQPSPYAFSQPDRQKSYVAMGRACHEDIGRFCPDISPLQLRNIAICLKPYRSNLSLGCRSSLWAAIAPAPGGPVN